MILLWKRTKLYLVFKSLVLPLGTSKVMSSKCLTSSNCRADYYAATLFLTSFYQMGTYKNTIHHWYNTNAHQSSVAVRGPESCVFISRLQALQKVASVSYSLVTVLNVPPILFFTFTLQYKKPISHAFQMGVAPLLFTAKHWPLTRIYSILTLPCFTVLRFN